MQTAMENLGKGFDEEAIAEDGAQKEKFLNFFLCILLNLKYLKYFFIYYFHTYKSLEGFDDLVIDCNFIVPILKSESNKKQLGKFFFGVRKKMKKKKPIIADFRKLCEQ